MAFPCLAVVLVICAILAIRYKQTGKNLQAENDAFWEREQKARTSISKSLDSLEYITIPLDKFPLNFSTDSRAKDLENQLKSLANERILNLTRKSNTDIKMDYGVLNFDEVVLMGDRYEQLASILVEYAKLLIENEMYKEAIAVLEFGLVTKSDLSSNYMLLADCYFELKQPRKLLMLLDQLPGLSLTLNSKVTEHINSLLEKLSD